jgi:hypothetical protein
LSNYSNNYNKTWTNISPNSETTNIPYVLTSFNISPYSPATKTLNSSQTGTSSTPPLPVISSETRTYSIIEVNGSYSIPSSITIDSSTGILTFTNVADGTYAILVYYIGSNNNYSVSKYTFTSAVCLVKGTKITIVTDGNENECRIEDLRCGDLIKTFNGIMRIKSIKSYDVYDIQFIRKIRKDCININVPDNDLYMTKSHGILFNKNKYDTYTTNLSKKIIYVDNFCKLQAENFNKCEMLNTDELELPIVCYNILLCDENDKESRHGIYANGLLVESMRPK